MASPGTAQFFTTRPSGVLTPLIAVDELPAHVSIRGVTRTLDVGETQGMTSCGLAVKRPEPWTIDGLSTTVSVFKSPDALALKETLARMIVDEAIPTHHRVTLQAILYEGLVDVGSLLTSTTATRMTQSQSSSQMSPLAPAFEAQNANAQNVQPARSSNILHPKKIYCSYWIRHGECDYSQQGCLYKHEMPLETDLLEKLGLRDIPRWYRDKFGVDSLVNHGLQHRTSSRLAITDQSQPSNPALHSPSSNSFEFKSSAPPPKQRSPPRAAHNHGTNGGVSQVRVSRSNAGWKGRQTRRQSVTASPSHTDPNASFHASLYDNAATPSSLSGYTAFLQTGAFGSGMATVTTAAPSVSSLAGNNNTNLKDSGSPHRTSTVTGESLTMAKDPFVDGFAVTANDIDKAHLKSKSRRAFEQHKAKDSSSVDGGVKLPVDSFYQYGSFSALANMDDAATNAIPGTESSSLSNQLDRSASKSPLSDIVSESDPLEEDDVRDAWGPVGSPVALTAAHAAANPPVVLVDRNLQYQHQRSPTVIRAFHPYAKSPHAN